MRQFSDIYRNRRVLITGHTGFKGSWLALWLSELGAEISGLALDPEVRPNHWELLNLSIIKDYRTDIRNVDAVFNAFKEIQPEIVFHLAAQPLVRRAYRDPLESWSTNVMGTANLLEACRQTRSVKNIIIVTTDKVYANFESSQGYRETDRLGGHDPYSASKAACEFLVESYRNAFFSEDCFPLVATVRAGNVIGGGDWAESRLIPDLVRSISQSTQLIIRSPESIRPWQHVLDCLNGYLLLGQKLIEGKRNFAESWNFGPDAYDNRKVSDILAQLQCLWPKLSWCQANEIQPHETKQLCLDIAKSKTKLAWTPLWHFEKSVQATAYWYWKFLNEGKIESRRQLGEYVETACKAGCVWIEK
jgi:CDP-glucose 4,6-dehydratase